MLHDLLHWTGIDTQQSYFYDFWSGIGTQITLLVGIIAAIRHHNCHVKGCWRLGHKDPLHGYPACRAHHSMANKLGGNDAR